MILLPAHRDRAPARRVRVLAARTRREPAAKAVVVGARRKPEVRASEPQARLEVLLASAGPERLEPVARAAHQPPEAVALVALPSAGPEELQALRPVVLAVPAVRRQARAQVALLRRAELPAMVVPAVRLPTIRSQV